MEFIISLHAKALHIVYTLAALAIIFPLVDVVRRRALSKASVWSVRAYMIGATLQFLLGITQLLARWSDFGDGLRYRVEHAGLMFVAIICIHMAPRFMRRNDVIGTRNTVILMVASLALVFLGVTLIRTVLRG